MLTFSLMVFAVNQLDILSYKLRQLKTYRGIDIDEYRKRFISLIKHHQDIIKYIDAFNAVMKYVMLFDFLQCSVQLATITLQFHVVSCFEIFTLNLVERGFR